jgi:hypothetical protein
MFRFSTLLLMFIALATWSSIAQARPDVRKMTCEQVQALVQREKAVVLTFTQYTYDRVISSKRGCTGAYYSQPIYRATKDLTKCKLGYICVPSNRDDWWLMFGNTR